MKSPDGERKKEKGRRNEEEAVEGKERFYRKASRFDPSLRKKFLEKIFLLDFLFTLIGDEKVSRSTRS